MKIQSFGARPLNFGKVLYSESDYTQEKLGKLDRTPVQDTFVRNMDKLDQDTKGQELEFMVTSDWEKAYSSSDDIVMLGNGYTGYRSFKLHKAFENINESEAQQMQDYFLRHPAIEYENLKDSPDAKKTMENVASYECFEISDDEQTQKALLLFSMYATDRFDEIMENFASVVKDQKISIKGRTEDINSAKLYLTDKDDFSTTMTLHKNIFRGYELESNISYFRPYREGLKAKIKKENEEAAKPFYNDFKNINLAKSEESDEIIARLLKENDGWFLLHEKFDWIDKLAQKAGIKLDAECTYLKTIAWTQQDGAFEYTYPAIKIKDDKGNSTILRYPKGPYCTHDRKQALNLMFNEKDITEIPGLAYARSEQYKHWW